MSVSATTSHYRSVSEPSSLATASVPFRTGPADSAPDFASSSILSVQDKKVSVREEKEFKGDAVAKISGNGQAAETHKFQEITENRFFNQFRYALQVPSDSMINSRIGSITTFALTDGIALFGYQKDGTIYAYNLSTACNLDNILEYLQSKLGAEVEGEHQLFLLGGNGSDGSKALLSNIRTAVNVYFGKQGTIVDEVINPLAGSKNKHVSANIQLKAKLTFCRHD